MEVKVEKDEETPRKVTEEEMRNLGSAVIINILRALPLWALIIYGLSWLF